MKSQREPGHVPTPLELFTSIAAWTAVWYLIFAAVGAVAAYLTSGSAAVWGLLLGVGIAGAAMGLTVVVMILTEKVSGIGDMVALLGSYLIKMFVLFVVLVVLRSFCFYDATALLLGFVGAVVISLTVDTVTIARTRA